MKTSATKSAPGLRSKSATSIGMTRVPLCVDSSDGISFLIRTTDCRTRSMGVRQSDQGT